MSENFEAILEAAQRLPVDERRQLVEQLVADIERDAARPAIKTRGAARQHFGAWDSGDERSADNDRIDRDLAREYEDSHRP